MHDNHGFSASGDGPAASIFILVMNATSTPLEPSLAGIAPLIAELLPRLRRMLAERGVARSRVCTYLGLHENTFQRLSDPSWHPRLDTIMKIASFLAEYESKPIPPLAGSGWALSHKDGHWTIDRTGNDSWVPLGPFDTPEAAIAAIQASEGDPA